MRLIIETAIDGLEESKPILTESEILEIEEQLMEALDLPGSLKGTKLPKEMAKLIGRSGGGPTAKWAQAKGLRGLGSDSLVVAQTPDKKHHFVIQNPQYGDGYQIHHVGPEGKVTKLLGHARTEYRGQSRNYPGYKVTVNDPLNQGGANYAMKNASGHDHSSYTYHVVSKPAPKRRPEGQRLSWEDRQTQEPGTIKRADAIRHLSTMAQKGSGAEELRARLHKHVDDVVSGYHKTHDGRSSDDPFHKAHAELTTTLDHLRRTRRDISYDVPYGSTVKRTDLLPAIKKIKGTSGEEK